MAVKSVIDVEINDAKFKAFAESFNKYHDAVTRSPAAWAAVGAIATKTETTFHKMVEAHKIMNAQIKRFNDQQAAGEEKARRTAHYWANTARAVKNITGELMKWSAISGVITGLLGGGGLFGLDLLARHVSAGRRSALGLGTTYGASDAFRINFGRFVDPDQFLSGVSEAQRDVTKRIGLIGAGLSQREMQGDTASVGAALLGHLKQIADQTPEGVMAQVMQMRHLDQFMSLQDMTRLKAMSPDELRQAQAGFARDQGTLGLPQQTQKAWQDFATQMSRAGTTIENVFVKGLTGLVGPLSSLSDGFTKVVAAFMGSDAVKHWIDLAGQGLQHFAEYISTPKFQEDVSAFISGIEAMAEAIERFVRWFEPVSPEEHAERFKHRFQHNDNFTPTTPGAVMKGWWDKAAEALTNSNNVGNIRNIGGRGFQTYATAQKGYDAMVRQILIDQDAHHVNTLRGLISSWSPANENDLPRLIREASGNTGLDPDKQLDFHDKRVLELLARAIATQEHGKAAGRSDMVRIAIDNQTGGSAVVSASQVAQ